MKKAYAKKGRKFISKLSLELELQAIFIFFLFILFAVTKKKVKKQKLMKAWPRVLAVTVHGYELCSRGRTNSAWFLVCAADTSGMNEWTELGKVVIAALAILPSLWFWTLPGSFPWSSSSAVGVVGMQWCFKPTWMRTTDRECRDTGLKMECVEFQHFKGMRMRKSSGKLGRVQQ